MKKDCEKYKAVIMSADGHLDRETCEHIASCRDCEALASAWMSLKNARLPGDGRTSPEMDFAVINRSDGVNRSHRISKPSSMLTKIIYFTAAAACLLLVSWLILSYNYRIPDDEQDYKMNWQATSMERDMLDIEIGLELVNEDLTSGEWRGEYKLINKQTEKLFDYDI